jgi:SAM-dependent methyltransferase
MACTRVWPSYGWRLPTLAAAVALVSGVHAAQSLRWTDLPATVQRRLTILGVHEASFPAFLTDHTRRTTERVRESDWDALIYYALQSTSFTKEKPIEPALDAKAFFEGLGEANRVRFLAGAEVPIDRVRVDTRRRLKAFAEALEKPASSGRLAYFREVSRDASAGGRALEPRLLSEYVRAARFLYEKEFLAPKRADSAAAVAELYRERGLSTDTAVEAGYLVHLGLATVAAADHRRRLDRVLIVGPGLDLAPRTGLIEAAEPESPQPYAVIDSLVALGLAGPERLSVVGADINPRVVDWLTGAGQRDVTLTFVTGIGETNAVKFDSGYRSYFAGLGQAIGAAVPGPPLNSRGAGHLMKQLRVSPVSRAVTGARLDIVTGRLDGDPFDLVVVTNVFPYFSDVELTLALANIVAMLKPGGVLIHNEPRALVREVTAELGLPLTHSRTAVIATVEGASPLYDSVWVHSRN